MELDVLSWEALRLDQQGPPQSPDWTLSLSSAQILREGHGGLHCCEANPQ